MSLANRTHSAVRKIADRRLLAVSGALWLSLAFVLFAWHGRFSIAAVADACGLEPPDVRFAPAAADTQAFLAACGDDGLTAYRDLQLVDLIYPAATALFLAVVLALLLRSVAPRVAWLAFLPVAAAVGDYLENAAAWVLLGVGGPDATGAAVVLQVGSAVKVAMSWASWLLVTVLLIAFAVRGLRARSRRPTAAPHADPTEAAPTELVR
jgi:hypothetical protein